MTAIDRFLRYVTYDTQSDEHSDAIPSTAKQKVLGAALAEELAQMGLHNAHMDELSATRGATWCSTRRRASS